MSKLEKNTILIWIISPGCTFPNKLERIAHKTRLSYMTAVTLCVQCVEKEHENIFFVTLFKHFDF